MATLNEPLRPSQTRRIVRGQRLRFVNERARKERTMSQFYNGEALLRSHAMSHFTAEFARTCPIGGRVVGRQLGA